MLLRTQRQLHKLRLGPLKLDQIPLRGSTLRVEDWLSQRKVLNIPKRIGSYNELTIYRNFMEKVKLSEVRINCLRVRLEGPQPLKKTSTRDLTISSVTSLSPVQVYGDSID